MARNNFILLQSQIELAMAKTSSNMAASRYLGVSFSTYRKYAMRYYREGDDSQRSLYEIHKNPHGKGSPKLKTKNVSRYTVEDLIVYNKCPKYPKERLKGYLLQEGYFQPRCNTCGFDEQRISDSQVPLIINCKDGNKENLLLENLELLCYNCYFLFVENLIRISKNLPKYLKLLHTNDPDHSTLDTN